ncbi:MarR family winged helix-turn-helix transcriptional regulator [Mycolicibacterium smegmatis]|uniref:MarR family winged helix-turn-helix transcriptional regulator n=1 Tax=Mycolicibacterium smegmatis TaxID=1772 RepID=UPI001303ABE8|nr:MarR family winged helix-turn-helix transcriptional regulator [Mycolicibacterium smegmatis]
MEEMSGGALSTTTGAESVSEVLFRASRWWVDALASGLLDDDISGIDGWRVLGSLRSGDGFTMSDISLALSIPPPTLTRVVDRLVDAGFVLRRVDVMDRRRVLIYLSARGKSKLRKLIRQEGMLKAALVEEFGEDTAVHLIRTLARVPELPLPSAR